VKSDHQIALEIHKAPTELQVEQKITQDVVDRLNMFPAAEWFHKHDDEPGFVTVGSFILALSELQNHASRAWLAVKNEDQEATDHLVTAGMAQLYENAPESGLWVARFWRTKARQGNATYFAAKEADLREDIRNSNGTSEEMEKIKKRFGDDIEMELTTYYYDHWREIKEMILQSLVADAVRREIRQEKKKDK
jgi:hypothetical protein